MDIRPMFLDLAPHNLVGAVLRWCDVANALSFKGLPADSEQDLLRLWQVCSVNRSTTLEVLVAERDWTLTLTEAGMVRVTPRIARVGRTSWVVHVDIASTSGTMLACMQTVFVLLDEQTLSKPQPLPHIDDLRAIVREASPLPSPDVCARPDDAFVWSCRVRCSDCDLLGHVNNAVYADFFESARRAGLAAGAITPELPATKGASDVHRVLVEYLGQPKAEDVAEVAVWWDAGARTYGVELVVSGKVMAKGAIAPQGRESTPAKL
mmetsp:Transcript_120013/g.339584  ORF Transcript_120013/g.339584 Transcript_120013/m.339584 type:complete len:265 (+) Transcript_120013:100-894(+)